MTRLTLLAAAFTLTACSVPTPTAMNETGVSIQYDEDVNDRASVVAEADKTCGQYGRAATFRNSTKPAPFGHRYDHFDCVRR
jgi:putative hemolysin